MAHRRGNEPRGVAIRVAVLRLTHSLLVLPQKLSCVSQYVVDADDSVIMLAACKILGSPPQGTTLHIPSEMAGKFSPVAGHMWKHGTYLADAGGRISTGARGGVWRSALGTIGIYIAIRKIRPGIARFFCSYAGHVWKHGTYLQRLFCTVTPTVP